MMVATIEVAALMVTCEGNGMFSGLIDGREFGVIYSGQLTRMSACGYIYDQPWGTAKGRNGMTSLDADQIARVTNHVYNCTAKVDKTHPDDGTSNSYTVLPMGIMPWPTG